MAWLAKQGVPVLTWIGQSPDQNPIENLWQEWKQIIMTEVQAAQEPEGAGGEDEPSLEAALQEEGPACQPL